MSEAVRRLIRRARDAVLTLEDEGYGNTPARLSAAIAAVETELSRTPQQQHEDRIEELDLQWNR